jgi:GTP-binding protein Era
VVPDSITEVTETEGPMLVRQTILVARDGHKGIVLGKGGAMLKEIGTRARMEMQKILGRGVRLELHVEVDEKWAGRADLLQALGVTH